MTLMYRVGFPGWKIAAKMGVPLRLRVNVHFDSEAKSYWADSPDLRGLVVTGDTLDELRQEARGAAEVLLEIALKNHAPQTQPDFLFRDAAIIPA